MMTTLYFNLNDVILVLSIGLSIVLALSQPLFSTRNQLSKYLLASFFTAIAISDIGILMVWNLHLPTTELIDDITPYFYATFMLLKGPILVLYVSSITQENFSLQREHLAHLLPSIGVFILIMAFQIDTPLLRLDTFGISSTTYRAIDTVWWLVKIIPLLYFTYGFFIVRNYHKTVLTQNSAVNERAIIWLYLLTIAYIGAGIWSVMLSVLAVLYRLPFGVTDNYINFCLLVSLYYFSVSFSQSITTAKVERKKNDSQTESLDNITGKIMAGIKEDKLYLKSNINVEQFSESIGLPYREVSFAINRVFGTNFFEFINTYRVEEAKRYLADERHLDMSVMDILLESGFNSKSSFQRFFKRLTGDSPTEYRKKMISQST